MSCVPWIMSSNYLEHIQRVLESGATVLEKCVQLGLPEEVLDLVAIMLGPDKSVYFVQSSVK